jgi:hypothetical protein
MLKMKQEVEMEQDRHELKAMGLSDIEIDGYFEIFADNYIGITYAIPKTISKGN